MRDMKSECAAAMERYARDHFHPDDAAVIIEAIPLFASPPDLAAETLAAFCAAHLSFMEDRKRMLLRPNKKPGFRPGGGSTKGQKRTRYSETRLQEECAAFNSLRECQRKKPSLYRQLALCADGYTVKRDVASDERLARVAPHWDNPQALRRKRQQELGGYRTPGELQAARPELWEDLMNCPTHTIRAILRLLSWGTFDANSYTLVAGKGRRARTDGAVLAELDALRTANPKEAYCLMALRQYHPTFFAYIRDRVRRRVNAGKTDNRLVARWEMLRKLNPPKKPQYLRKTSSRVQREAAYRGRIQSAASRDLPKVEEVLTRLGLRSSRELVHLRWLIQDKGPQVINGVTVNRIAIPNGAIGFAIDDPTLDQLEMLAVRYPTATVAWRNERKLVEFGRRHPEIWRGVWRSKKDPRITGTRAKRARGCNRATLDLTTDFGCFP